MVQAKKVKAGVVDIVYEGQNVTLDLFKKVPFDFLKKNYKGQTYIPVHLVRAICLSLNIFPSNIQVENIMGDSGVIVSVTLDIDGVSGFAQDYFNGKTIASSTVGNSAKVMALALKAALRFKYPFFEGESFEDPESLIPIEQPAETKKVNDGLAGYKKDIIEANDSTTLNKIGVKLASDINLGKTAKEELRALYIKKTKEIGLK